MAAAAGDQMPSCKKGLFIFKEIKNAQQSMLGHTKMEKEPRRKSIFARNDDNDTEANRLIINKELSQLKDLNGKV